MRTFKKILNKYLISIPGDRNSFSITQNTGWTQHQVTLKTNMAIHTSVGLGDFILMEKINMEEFTRNLKIRCGPVRE